MWVLGVCEGLCGGDSGLETSPETPWRECTFRDSKK